MCKAVSVKLKVQYRVFPRKLETQRMCIMCCGEWQAVRTAKRTQEKVKGAVTGNVIEVGVPEASGAYISALHVLDAGSTGLNSFPVVFQFCFGSILF